MDLDIIHGQLMNRLSPQHMIAQSTRDTEKDYSELSEKNNEWEKLRILIRTAQVHENGTSRLSENINHAKGYAGK